MNPKPPYFANVKPLGLDHPVQGVVTSESPDSCTVLCESGEIYKCKNNPVHIPLKFMWGETKDFAIKHGVIE